MAIYQEMRIDMQVISPELLIHFMEHKGFTVTTLTEAVQIHLKRKKVDAKVSRATIGFLRSKGKSARRTCPPAVARAIEDVLDVPRESLFRSRVSTVSRERGKVPA